MLRLLNPTHFRAEDWTCPETSEWDTPRIGMMFIVSLSLTAGGNSQSSRQSACTCGKLGPDAVPSPMGKNHLVFMKLNAHGSQSAHHGLQPIIFRISSFILQLLARFVAPELGHPYSVQPAVVGNAFKLPRPPPFITLLFPNTSADSAPKFESHLRFTEIHSFFLSTQSLFLNICFLHSLIPFTTFVATSISLAG